MNEDQRDILARWRAEYPTAQEGAPSTVDLAASQIRDRREQAAVAELSQQIDALGDAVALDLASTPAIQELDPDAIGGALGLAEDHHEAATLAAVAGDQAALENALQAHADALRSLAASAPASGADPSQYRPAPAPSTPSHPLIANQPLPGSDARQSRSVSGVYPGIGGGPLRGGPG
jgi:hypothetical protein